MTRGKQDTPRCAREPLPRVEAFASASGHFNPLGTARKPTTSSPLLQPLRLLTRRPLSTLTGGSQYVSDLITPRGSPQPEEPLG